jgi:acetoin utilization deacetylase AcuC-like enzyme
LPSKFRRSDVCLTARVRSRRAFLRQTSGALLSLGNGLAAAAAEIPKTQVFYDPATLRHEPSADHPESPKRLVAVMDAVRTLVRQGGLTVATPQPATEDEVLLVHSSEYLKKVRSEIAAGRRELSTGDTEISAGSFTAALAAAGTVVSAVDAVASGRARRAFCAVRPPGHHASQSRGMGFCVFNNIAIGARHARRRRGIERILIADWDVHHGNGTQEVFWNDGLVLFFDTHQHPWYPGTGAPDETGEGRGRGLIVNRPFPAGAGRNEILGVFREVLVPAAERFKPELVMVSAGFDSRAGDPLGQFTLTDGDFAELTDVVVEIARQHAGGRLVSVLEGGYALEGLPRAVGAHLTRLMA